MLRKLIKLNEMTQFNNYFGAVSEAEKIAAYALFAQNILRVTCSRLAKLDFQQLSGILRT